LEQVDEPRREAREDEELAFGRSDRSGSSDTMTLIPVSVP
jgi:hypothetical protein